MKSTTNVTIRAAVMLTFLVVVPVIALCGTSPDMAKLRVGIVSRWDSLWSETTAEVDVGKETAPTKTKDTEKNDWPTGSDTNLDRDFRQLGQSDETRPMNNVPDKREFAQGRQPAVRKDRTTQPGNDVSGRFKEEPSERLEKKLRSLGAVRYRLERDQPDGDYWFFCQVAGFEKPLQSRDTDPLVAMQRVIEEIEQKKLARQ